MKNQEVRTILAVSVLSVGLALSACGNKEDTPVESPVVVEQVSENTVSDSIVDDLSSNGIAVIDGNLDTSLAGNYFIITEAQSIYKESNKSSEVVDTLAVDTEITVSGVYGQTSFFQVVNTNGTILGYVDSAFCDTVKGGLNPDAVSDNSVSSNTANNTGITEESTGMTQEQLSQAIQDALKEEANSGSSGDFGTWVPPADASVGDGTAPVIAGDSGLGDGSGLTPCEVN